MTNNTDASSKPVNDSSDVPAQPASKQQPKDPSLYFDPLGAVSIPEDPSSSKLQTEETQSINEKVGENDVNNQDNVLSSSDVSTSASSVLGNEMTVEAISKMKNESNDVTAMSPSQSDSVESVSSAGVMLGTVPLVGAEAIKMQTNNNSVAETEPEQGTTVNTDSCKSSERDGEAIKLEETVEISDSDPVTDTCTSDRSKEADHNVSTNNDEEIVTTESGETDLRPDSASNEASSVVDINTAPQSNDDTVLTSINQDNTEEASSPSHNVPTLKELASTASTIVPAATPPTESNDNQSDAVSRVTEANSSPEKCAPGGDNLTIDPINHTVVDLVCSDAEEIKQVESSDETETSLKEDILVADKLDVTATDQDDELEVDEGEIDSLADDLVADAVKSAVKDIAADIMSENSADPAASLSDRDPIINIDPKKPCSESEVLSNKATIEKTDAVSDVVKPDTVNSAEISDKLVDADCVASTENAAYNSEIGGGDTTSSASISVETIPTLKQLAEKACPS